MVETANTIWRDYVTDGVPSSTKNKPKKSEIRAWGAWIEGIITAFTANGGLIYSSKAALDADLAHAANTMAWVLGDATVANNGVYQKQGASGAGSWTRVADLPFSFIIASDAGAGTANAIQATTDIPVSSSALIWMNIFEANTASPVTVSFNGGSALTIKTNSGNDVAAGGLTAGMIVLGIVSGSHFRLVSDQASGAVLAAAEAAAAAALAAANAGFVFDTEADFEAANIPASLDFVRVAGYGLPGDSGAHTKRRLSAAPSPIKPWHNQSADGAWWQIVEPVMRPEMFAVIAYVASPYGATQVAAASDASAALDAASEYATTFGVPCRLLGRWYKRTTEWLWRSTLDIEGEGIGRWTPTLNQSIAGGVGKPTGDGTVILYVGTGAKTRKALGITDMRTAGGVVVNSDSREPGYDNNFKLTDYYNEDSNTTTGAAATAKTMSAAVYMAPGTHGIKARGLRIMPSFNGLAGYEAGTLALGDDWDLGFYFDNTEWCDFSDVQAVGYWRKHGRFIRAGTVESEGTTAQTGCEHLIFHNCTFTGAAAGSAIRGPDRDKVTAVGSNYVEIEWRANHPYDPTLLGNTFRLANGAGSFFDFTGLSKTGSTLRLTGVTPDPSAAGVTTSSHITPGNLSNGMDNITDYNCSLSGLDHQGAVRSTSASLGAARQTKPSACLELSGWRLQGYRCIFSEFISHDDVGFHLHDCSTTEFSPNVDIESKVADGLGLGIVCIGSPSEASNTRVTNPAGQTFFLTVDAREGGTDFRPFLSAGTARFPTAPALGGYLQANQFKYSKQQFISDNDTYLKPPNDRKVGFKDNAGSPRFYLDDLNGNLEASLANGAALSVLINGTQVLKAKTPVQGVRHHDTDGIPHCLYFSIADDAVAAIDFGASHFVADVEVHSTGTPVFFGKFTARAATGPSMTRVVNADSGTSVSATTGALTGTTGVDGAMTVSCDTAGRYWVENRSGGSRNVLLKISAGNYTA